MGEEPSDSSYYSSEEENVDPSPHLVVAQVSQPISPETKSQSQSKQNVSQSSESGSSASSSASTSASSERSHFSAPSPISSPKIATSSFRPMEQFSSQPKSKEAINSLSPEDLPWSPPLLPFLLLSPIASPPNWSLPTVTTERLNSDERVKNVSNSSSSSSSTASSSSSSSSSVSSSPSSKRSSRAARNSSSSSNDSEIAYENESKVSKSLPNRPSSSNQLSPQKSPPHESLLQASKAASLFSPIWAHETSTKEEWTPPQRVLSFLTPLSSPQQTKTWESSLKSSSGELRRSRLTLSSSTPTPISFSPHGPTPVTPSHGSVTTEVSTLSPVLMVTPMNSPIQQKQPVPPIKSQESMYSPFTPSFESEALAWKLLPPSSPISVVQEEFQQTNTSLVESNLRRPSREFSKRSLSSSNSFSRSNSSRSSRSSSNSPSESPELVDLSSMNESESMLSLEKSTMQVETSPSILQGSVPSPKNSKAIQQPQLPPFEVESMEVGAMKQKETVIIQRTIAIQTSPMHRWSSSSLPLQFSQLCPLKTQGPERILKPPAPTAFTKEPSPVPQANSPILKKLMARGTMSVSPPSKMPPEPSIFRSNRKSSKATLISSLFSDTPTRSVIGSPSNKSRSMFDTKFSSERSPKLPSSPTLSKPSPSTSLKSVSSTSSESDESVITKLTETVRKSSKFDLKSASQTSSCSKAKLLDYLFVSHPSSISPDPSDKSRSRSRSRSRSPSPVTSRTPSPGSASSFSELLRPPLTPTPRSSSPSSSPPTPWKNRVFIRAESPIPSRPITPTPRSSSPSPSPPREIRRCCRKSRKKMFGCAG